MRNEKYAIFTLMHPAIIIGTVRSLIVDVAMGQIPRSTERISSCYYDRSKEYKVTEGRILACSIGMACRLYRDLFRDTPTIIDKEIKYPSQIILKK